MVHGRQFIIFPFDDLILDLTAQTLIDHAEDKTRQRESRILFTYFQSLAVMRKAKDLAASGNVRELEVFASSEVKRTSQSLQERQLSQDGRVKDGEKQAHVKTRKEDLVYENPKKEEQEEEEVDEETFKERKREEQAEKARLPMERKRKLQKKAAAKAAIRAQKEAEKKLKECEKKAKKKAAAANSPAPSESDQSREAISEKVTTLAVSGNERHQKEEKLLFPTQRSFRYKHRGRGTEALPK
ncbi:unnamed protein product [Microthlaspi erraticum]|uniref:Uncharacterized protein n=1 Tax=Microthlaspi erraticum TaxID=1685480 RepID=A0A6D2KLU6_9BRAS|nr:unnamed protein product [Microthlaspi erraticum]